MGGVLIVEQAGRASGDEGEGDDRAEGFPGCHQTQAERSEGPDGEGALELLHVAELCELCIIGDDFVQAGLC